MGSRYGAETSAPVFKEVAQQVLEYLGVPHDQPLKTVKPSDSLEIAARPPVEEDGASEPMGDLNALYAEANSLPADDPLHPATTTVTNQPTGEAQPVRVATAPTRASSILAALPEGLVRAFREHGGNSFMPEETAAVKPLPKPQADAITRADGAIVVDASRRVAVPVFDGDRFTCCDREGRSRRPADTAGR